MKHPRSSSLPFAHNYAGNTAMPSSLCTASGPSGVPRRTNGKAIWVSNQLSKFTSSVPAPHALLPPRWTST
eukprot:CAMPEP_0179162052 /NCGR_PEP_ID=MMETSP0796-20121207/79364_1 /TAXON_ID=73915 /ORGANISM="Pyrodinium bahamense, Strain pbaha01" /LENGTH=70 /DNA_ID=CAMNT_0020864217 /DNA_START=49 /DNA_END=258 /DNA_ORIENTATION=+